MLPGLALCGVGYSTDDLGLKKHNIMAKDKDNDKDNVERSSGVGDGVRARGGGLGVGPPRIEAPRRKLFKVSLPPLFCHSRCRS